MSSRPAFLYVLAFGSNLGDKFQNLRRGFEFLKMHASVESESPWVETAPLTSSEYKTAHHDLYLNFVCVVKSDLSPAQLHEKIKIIEDKIGHNREKKWEPRHLDIDILFCYVGDKIASASPYHFKNTLSDLQIPHPGYCHRPFLQELMLSLS